MDVKLLAFDLDGTLLDKQSRLVPDNRDAIAAARAAGVDVILVTGRSWRSTRPYYEELELSGPAFCYLGAVVIAGGDGRILRHRPLPQGAWEQLRHFAVSEGLAVTACMGTDRAVADGRLPDTDLVAADTAYATCEAADFHAWSDWNPYTVMAPDLGQCQSPPIMLAVYGDRAVHRVLEAFPDGMAGCQFDLSDKIKGETVLHIFHHEVDKGSALAAYCESRGLQRCEVAAFGDMPMDAGMLRFAGLGVAVPDAHPKLLAVADWVMPPAEAVRQLLGGARVCAD